jgi:hypothetical protein
VLIHAAIGDHQVTPLGAHILARTVSAKNLAPVNRDIWGVDSGPAPLMGGSAIVEFNFGLPEAPKTDTPPYMGEDPHDMVRVLTAAIDQSDQFFRTGTVVQTCKAACTPE